MFIEAPNPKRLGHSVAIVACDCFFAASTQLQVDNSNRLDAVLNTATMDLKN